MANWPIPKFVQKISSFLPTPHPTSVKLAEKILTLAESATFAPEQPFVLYEHFMDDMHSIVLEWHNETMDRKIKITYGRSNLNTKNTNNVSFNIEMTRSALDENLIPELDVWKKGQELTGTACRILNGESEDQKFQEAIAWFFGDSAVTEIRDIKSAFEDHLNQQLNQQSDDFLPNQEWQPDEEDDDQESDI